MTSWGTWPRNGGVLIQWDAESEPLWERILQVVPPFQQAAERERYMRRLGDTDDDPNQDYDEA